VRRSSTRSQSVASRERERAGFVPPPNPRLIINRRRSRSTLVGGDRVAMMASWYGGAT
jgi:hypothetical protein